MLAEALLDQGRIDEAAEVADRARAWAPKDQAPHHARCARSARACARAAGRSRCRGARAGGGSASPTKRTSSSSRATACSLSPTCSEAPKARWSRRSSGTRGRGPRSWSRRLARCWQPEAVRGGRLVLDEYATRVVEGAAPRLGEPEHHDRAGDEHAEHVPVRVANRVRRQRPVLVVDDRHETNDAGEGHEPVQPDAELRLRSRQ